MLSWIGTTQRQQLYNQIASLRLRPIYLCSIPCLIFFVFIYLPSDRDSTLSVTWQNDTTDSMLSVTSQNGTMDSWDYKRDGKRLVITKGMYEQSFPGLYQHIDRMVEKRRNGKITQKMLDAIAHRNGYVRVMLYDQQVEFSRFI